MSELAEQIKKWVEENKIKTLNVAGSRASKDSRIYRKTLELLEITFSG
jgi:hypothetical protein